MSVKRIAVALLLVLAGCSSTLPTTQSSGPSYDKTFLGLVGNEGPSNLDDAALIRVGHVVCEQYAADPKPSASTWRVEVKALVISGSFTEYQASLVVAAAVGAYCPQYGKFAPS